MKRFQVVCAGLLCGVIGLSAGCREEAPPMTPPEVPPPVPEVPALPPPPDEPLTRSDVMREGGEAVDTAARYAQQEKDRFVAASQEQMSALRARWDGWRADAGERAAELKNDLDVRYQDAAAKLAQVKDASGDAWVELKDGFVAAYAELEAATKAAATKLAPDAKPEAIDVPDEPTDLMDK